MTARHVVVTGGAGGVGAEVVRLLAGDPRIGRLDVADRDPAAAAALAREVGGPARPVGLDLTDDRATRAAFEGADLVCSCAGPFSLLGEGALVAAIDAGAGWVDVCDDWQPTLDLLALDDRARGAGVTAIVGMGASPGLTNLLALAAAAPLDEVDRVVTAWSEDVEELRGQTAHPAARLHWVDQMSHPIGVWRDGRIQLVDPLERIPLRTPDGLVGDVVSVGHPEAVTLQLGIPGLREARNAMVISPDLAGVLDRVAAAVGDGLPVADGSDLLGELVDALPPVTTPPPPLPRLFAQAEGRRDGVPHAGLAEVVAFPGHAMGVVTAVPLVVVAGLLLDGAVRHPGVHPPERVVPPAAFWAAYATACGVPADQVVRLVDGPVHR